MPRPKLPPEEKKRRRAATQKKYKESLGGKQAQQRADAKHKPTRQAESGERKQAKQVASATQTYDRAIATCDAELSSLSQWAYWQPETEPIATQSVEVRPVEVVKPKPFTLPDSIKAWIKWYHSQKHGFSYERLEHICLGSRSAPRPHDSTPTPYAEMAAFDQWRIDREECDALYRASLILIPPLEELIAQAKREVKREIRYWTKRRAFLARIRDRAAKLAANEGQRKKQRPAFEKDFALRHPAQTGPNYVDPAVIGELLENAKWDLKMAESRLRHELTVRKESLRDKVVLRERIRHCVGRCRYAKSAIKSLETWLDTLSPKKQTTMEAMNEKGRSSDHWSESVGS